MGLRAWIRSLLGRRPAVDAWWSRPGAPGFRLDPSANYMPDGQTVRLLMTLEQVRGRDVEASLRGRWRGAGVAMDFATPLIDIREHTYQMPSTIADPLQASDPDVPPVHVAFELRFELDGQERHCLWRWPLVQERDGRWALADGGTAAEAPAARW